MPRCTSKTLALPCIVFAPLHVSAGTSPQHTRDVTGEIFVSHDIEVALRSAPNNSISAGSDFPG